MCDLRRAPDGFNIRVRSFYAEKDNFYDNDYPEDIVPIFELRLYDTNTYRPGFKLIAGFLWLAKIKSGDWETHSELEPEYRGRGLGTLLYARAFDYGMNHKLSVVSSLNPSADAQRVWRSRSINDKFFVGYNKRFLMCGRK